MRRKGCFTCFICCGVTMTAIFGTIMALFYTTDYMLEELDYMPTVFPIPIYFGPKPFIGITMSWFDEVDPTNGNNIIYVFEEKPPMTDRNVSEFLQESISLPPRSQVWFSWYLASGAKLEIEWSFSDPVNIQLYNSTQDWYDGPEQRDWYTSSGSSTILIGEENFYWLDLYNPEVKNLISGQLSILVTSKVFNISNSTQSFKNLLGDVVQPIPDNPYYVFVACDSSDIIYRGNMLLETDYALPLWQRVVAVIVPVIGFNLMLAAIWACRIYCNCECGCKPRAVIPAPQPMDYLGEWKPNTHHLFPKKIRKQIVSLLIVANRQTWPLPKHVLYEICDMIAYNNGNSSHNMVNSQSTQQSDSLA